MNDAKLSCYVCVGECACICKCVCVCACMRVCVYVSVRDTCRLVYVERQMINSFQGVLLDDGMFL